MWLKAGGKLSKWHCSLSDPSLTDSTTMQQRGLPNPDEHLRLCPLQHNRCTETKKYDSNERTDQNSRERAKQWADRQPIWCRVQNTGNQHAHRTGWVWLQKRGRSEGYAKWNKNIQGTNSERKETGTQINDLEQKEEINIQPKQNEEQEIKKRKKKWGEA